MEPEDTEIKERKTNNLNGRFFLPSAVWKSMFSEPGKLDQKNYDFI
jgi:hypothetical protein